MIRSKGKLISFQTTSQDKAGPDEPTEPVAGWGATLDLANSNATLVNTSPSTEDALLLESLLGQQANEAIGKELLSYRPPASADIVMTREVTGTGNQPVTITACTLSATLEFQNASTSEVVLEVLEQKGRRHQITCHSTDATNPNDLNGQTDGIAPLFRIYNTGTTVEVRAPAQFGNEVFKEWQDRDGKVVSTQPAFTFEIDAAKVDTHGEFFLQCVYAVAEPAASAGIARG